MSDRQLSEAEESAKDAMLTVDVLKLARERLQFREREIVERIAHGPFTDRMDEYARKLLHVREAGKVLDAWIEEECAAMPAPGPFDPDPALSGRRVGG